MEGSVQCVLPLRADGSICAPIPGPNGRHHLFLITMVAGCQISSRGIEGLRERAPGSDAQQGQCLPVDLCLDNTPRLTWLFSSCTCGLLSPSKCLTGKSVRAGRTSEVRICQKVPGESRRLFHASSSLFKLRSRSSATD